jgi:hypothetical protein
MILATSRLLQRVPKETKMALKANTIVCNYRVEVPLSSVVLGFELRALHLLVRHSYRLSLSTSWNFLIKKNKSTYLLEYLLG